MSSTEVRIPYGDDSRSFAVEGAELVEVYTPRPTAPATDPEREIRDALAHPIDSPRLRDAARGKRSALLLVDDATRDTPATLIVPALLDELQAAGLPPDAVRVMIALGTHRPMTQSEIAAKLGSDVTTAVEVLQHDYTVASLENLGTTPNGTPALVNQALFETDLVIGTGSVVPHHIAGFSAGAKIVQPGVSGAETTAATHMFSAGSDAPLLGQVDSPVRLEMEHIAERSNMPFVLNVTLNSDGRLVSAYFGDTRRAFRLAVQDARDIYGVPTKRHFDIVIAGSHPCDMEFWQAHKSLYPAAMMVRRGGSIVVVTPCAEGVTATHEDLLNYASDPAEAIVELYESGATADRVATSLAVAWARVREYADVILVSGGIGSDEARALGFRKADDIDDALRTAFATAPDRPTVGVLTHAPDTLPLVS